MAEKGDGARADGSGLLIKASILRRQLSDNLEEVTLINNYGKKNLSNLATASSTCKSVMKGSSEALQTHYHKFNSLWAELGTLYDSHSKTMEFPSEDDQRMKRDLRSAYFSACGTIEAIRTRDASKLHDDATINLSQPESRPARNLPKLSLPTFEGQLLEWPRFRDTYTSIVHDDPSLTPIERFQYLRVSLKGAALSVISNLKVEDANYALAWKALTDTYDNKRMLAAAYMDQLLNFKPLQGKATPDSLNSFLSSVSDAIAAFQLLTIPDEAQFILFHLSIRLLDPNTRELFETKYSGKDTFPTFQQLSDFVRERSLTLQLSNTSSFDTSMSSNEQQSTNKSKKPPKPKNQVKTSLLTNTETTANQKTTLGSLKPKTEGSPCFVCHRESHSLMNCETFNQKSAPERIALLKGWKGCLNCLSAAHKVADCASKWHCRFCPERHNSLLHPYSSSPVQSSPGTSLTTSSISENQIVLGTAIARIQDSHGQFQDVRMVIDSASQNSFITLRCLKRLGLKMSSTERRISGIGQTLFDGAKGSVACIIKPRGKTTVRLSTEAIVVTVITSHLPSTPLPKWVISKFEDVELADPNFGKPGSIDFLLGADLFTDIWTGTVKELDGAGPKLLSSIFGYVVMGRIESTSSPTSTSLLVLNKSTDIHFQLERFWEMEQPAPVTKIVDAEDQWCEDHFLKTHYRHHSGRYVVRLPFRDDNPTVGNSSSIALQGFYGLERKLKKDGSTRKKYHDFLIEYEELNHMSPANAPSKLFRIHNIQAHNTEELVDLSLPEEQWVKILGLQWDPQLDCFLFTIGNTNPNVTKRGVLSTVARIYDPLGFLTPTTLMMKGFIQDLWIKKLDWDEPLTDGLRESWTKLTEELKLLSALRIPRFLGTSPDATSCQLVGFSDASNRGYAAVLYLRVNSPSGYNTTLLTSKSKLSPTKTQSVPRLELSGALLLAELYSTVQPLIQTFNLPLETPAFFSDSQTVLAWLRTPPHKLKIFVSNRVARIQEIIEPELWRHVRSEENPSDPASRGILPSQLLGHSLWWSGPAWLSKDQSHWPSSKIESPKELSDLKCGETSSLLVSHVSDAVVQWMARFSSYSTLVKSAGWLKRWIYNVRHGKCCCCPWRFGNLTQAEVKEGLTFCIKATQTFYFNNSSQVLKRYANLRPYVAADGLWRVGGRLRHSAVPDSQKNPILLPHEAHLSVLLVDYYHKIYLHPGPTTLQAVIQTQFWIPSLRRLIYLRGFRCKTCYESKTNTVAPIMGDLPTYRVNGGRTFQHVGIDFAGPFPLKESSRRNASIGKVYLCLYVCMATKALHLEAVTRLTTDAFLASFQRFTSRRGIPSDVYTDRGSNFLGAARYLKELYQWFCAEGTKEALIEYAKETEIRWHFNPPHTPHMGGIWEAGVKSVKRYLRLVASDTALTYEEISTWFAKIEAILNSRPLCPLSSDPAENDYLSPGHFLVGGPLVVAPEPSLLDTKENTLSRWQLVSRLSEQFWQRWSHEYLSTLQKRPKLVKVRKNLEVGDLVLLKESSPPLHWRLARVEEALPGADGTVRIVKLRRGDSTLLPHVVNLIPLPHLSTPSFPEAPKVSI